jgi:uncharacterized protein
MGRDRIIELIAADRAALQRLGVESLRLFGSAARDEAADGSDADFLVRFLGAPDFDRFMDLKFHLEGLLGLNVDLVTEAALRPQLRQSAEHDAIRVA